MLQQGHEQESLVVRVGRRIQQLRHERGLSLQDFGQRTGISLERISAIELGQISASARTLQALARALDVQMLDLLNHDPDSEGNDIGHVIELMRKRPEYVRRIMRDVKPLVVN